MSLYQNNHMPLFFTLSPYTLRCRLLWAYLLMGSIFLLHGYVGKAQSQALTANEACRKIAESHGIEAWPKVQEVRFTFSVQLPDRQVERRWRWLPGYQKVTLLADDPADERTYQRSEQLSDMEKKLDAMFINDQYWLLFPFHLVWDTGFEAEWAPEAEAPISGEPMHRLTVQYNAEDGYTPGDAYDLFVDDDFIVREWIYRKGGGEEPSRVTTWEGYEEVMGMKIATEHRAPEGSNFMIQIRELVVH